MSNIENILAGLRNILEGYIRLEPGWDGYSGVPITRSLADKGYTTAQAVIAAGMPCGRLSAATGNGLSMELIMYCGPVDVFVDVDEDDAPDEYNAIVRSRNPDGRPQYSVLTADSWNELVNKVKGLVK